MKTYFLTQDFVSGVIPNTNGKPNILFKKGDQIIGQTTEAFIFNKRTKGITAKPTVTGSYNESPDGLVFVPFSFIKIVADNSPQSSKSGEAPQGKNTKASNVFNTKNIIIITIVIGLIFGGLKLAKVI